MNKENEIEGINDFYAKLNLEKGRGVWQNNHSKIDFILDHSLKYCPQIQKITEFGIGDGYLLRTLSENNIKCTGVDISSYLINKHKTNHDFANIDLIVSNIASKQVPIIENQDIVFCIDILEHLTKGELKSAIENIYMILKPDGFFIISFPYDENMIKKMVFCPECGHSFHMVGHKQVLNKEVIKNFFQDKFQILEIGEVMLEKTNNNIFLSYLSFIKKILKKILFHGKGEITAGQTVYLIAKKLL
jgi:2-polyprenyl-3-methyl-5-hydroxy-6-metoxy-1,4-benzoquinol methylase